VRRPIRSVAVGLRRGTVAGTGAAVGSQPGVADSEEVGRTTAVRAAWIMVILTDETWQSVARSRAAVHRRYWAARFRVLVDHT